MPDSFAVGRREVALVSDFLKAGTRAHQTQLASENLHPIPGYQNSFSVCFFICKMEITHSTFSELLWALTEMDSAWHLAHSRYLTVAAIAYKRKLIPSAMSTVPCTVQRACNEASRMSSRGWILRGHTCIGAGAQCYEDKLYCFEILAQIRFVRKHALASLGNGITQELRDSGQNQL